jgi:hypothetical protein
MVLGGGIMHVVFKQSTEAGKGHTRYALKKNILIIPTLIIM